MSIMTDAGANIFEVAARARQQQVESEIAEVQSPIEHVVVQPDSSEVNNPEVSDQVVPQSKPPLPMYPIGTQLFSYTFKSTGVTIQLPMGFERPDAVWMWEQFDRPYHIQTWMWMKRANVPKAVQRQVVSHLQPHEDEYVECFNKWFEAMGGGATSGE